MKHFPLEKYHYYFAGNKIIAFEDQEIFVGKIEDYRRKMHESL